LRKAKNYTALYRYLSVGLYVCGDLDPDA